MKQYGSFGHIGKSVRKLSSLTVISTSPMSNVHTVDSRALLLNFLILYGFGALGQIVPNFTGVYRRGFFCDDESITYSYKKDTVSTPMLILYSIMINVVVIICVEFYRQSRVEAAIEPRQYKWRNRHVNALFVKFLTYLGYSQIGFICTLTLTNVTKNVIGRLRPHFLMICQPVNTNCTDIHHYVTEYVCSGDPSKELEARKSFFSGHSSMAMYCSVWSALYLQARLVPVCKNRIAVPILQTIIISFGLIICYTRVNDNMHHWTDVLVGIFIGSFIAAYTCICWTDIFKKKNSEKIHLVQPDYSGISAESELPSESSVTGVPKDVSGVEAGGDPIEVV